MIGRRYPQRLRSWKREVPKRRRRRAALAAAGAITLSVADVTHAHTVDSIAVTQTHNLVVADATHAHSVDNVGITSINFPYPVSVSGRKFLDQNGDPWVLKGYASWALGQNASNAEITDVMEGLAARGFNSLIVAPFGVNNPGGAGWSQFENDAGADFFTGTPFQSSFGSAWSSFDHLMSEAARLGFTPCLDFFLSWGTTGIATQVIAAGTTNMYNFGVTLATRYAAYPNIIWHVEADDSWDYPAGPSEEVDAMFHGIRDTEGSTHRLILAEPYGTRSSYDQFISQEGTSGSGYEWFLVDANTPLRSSPGDVGSETADESVITTDAGYNETGATTIPLWCDEPIYANNPWYTGNQGQQLRERNYSTFIRGGIGMNFGDEYFWPAGAPGLFGGTQATWATQVDATPTVEAGYCWALIDEYCADTTWAPNDALIATGVGSGDTKAAGGASDTAALAYFPTNRTIVVDTTVIAGTGAVRLRWYDPVLGTFSTISGSEAQNASRSVTLPAARGDSTRDFVLVVDGVPTLVVADVTHGHTADNVVLTQSHVLTVADATHGHAVDAVVLTQTHQLAGVADVLHAHTADAVTLVQTHVLVVADVTHGHTADAVVLTQTHNLAVADATHGHTADNVVLTTAVTLVVADATHGHTADNITLTQTHNLAVADATHGHTVDNVALVQTHNLVVADGLHGHTADNVTLLAGLTLAVADATHGHTVDNVALTQTHNLVVQDATHGHTADPVTLVVTYTLAVQDATHGHAVDNVVLTIAGFTLVVADVTHGHTADAVGLVQFHNLVVADVLHGHTVETPAINGFNPAAVPDYDGTRLTTDNINQKRITAKVER